MIKNYLLLFCLLLLSLFDYAQLPYNPREWDTNWITAKFSDSFDETSLNTDKWKVVTNFGRGNCVFLDAPDVTYSLDGENLQLNMIFQPGYCYVLEGDTICKNYISAEIVSEETYKYGIYEGRMKFSIQRGSWPAFWFYGGSGADDPQYNNGYASEIDIAEYNWYANLLNYDPKTEHVLHWWGPDGELPIEGKTKEEANVDWDDWHTFKLIYTPYYLKFYVDGILSWRRSRFYIINGSGQQEEIDVEEIDEYTTYYEYEGFPRHEGNIILSQQAAGSVELPLVAPQTSLFDWVTFKEFFLAPEITCPDIICSSDSATLDVDSDALNISWSLSPAGLFTGATSGSGKNASINVGSANGEGKITYTFDMPGGEEFEVDKSFWVGEPVISSISGPMNTPNNQWATYYAQPNNYLMEADDYTWILNPLNGNSVYDYGWSCDIAFYNSGSYQLITQAHNTCGWGDYYVTGVVVYDTYRLLISPTPTSGEVTLTIESTDKKELLSQEEWELEVYDNVQNLKEKKTKLKGNQYKFNTSGWKDGVYAVRVKYKDQILTEKLIVKR